jgi:uncharacterized membrane protein
MDIQDWYATRGDFSPVTYRNIKEFHSTVGDARVSIYEMATRDYAVILTEIIARNNDFESLKKELTEFVKERTEFADWMESNRHPTTGDYSFD